MTDLKKKLREVNKLRKEVSTIEAEIQEEGQKLFQDRLMVVVMKKGQIDDLMKDIFQKELNLTNERVDIIEALVVLEEKANPKGNLIL